MCGLYFALWMSILLAMARASPQPSNEDGRAQDVAHVEKLNPVLCATANGYFPDPTQCDKYYACVDGVPTEKICADGLAFKDDNSERENCVFLSLVECGDRNVLQPARVSPSCPRANGYFAHHDESLCQEFYFCNKGEPTHITCPGELYFSIASLTCERPSVSGRVGCGCKFGNKKYSDGDILDESCMLLKCTNNAWGYTGEIDEDCGMCGVHGDNSTMITFDKHGNPDINVDLYNFNGAGTYDMLILDRLGFGLQSTFKICGDIQQSCVTNIYYYEPGLNVEVILDSNAPYKVLVNGREPHIGSSVSIYHADDETVLLFKDNRIGEDVLHGGEHDVDNEVNHGDDLSCINIVVSKGFSVTLCQYLLGYAFLHIRAMTSLKSQPSQLYGLCDTYTGTIREYYTDRDGSNNKNVPIFVESWKIEKKLALAKFPDVAMDDEDSCVCSYEEGGCVLKSKPPKHKACKCIYIGLWTCGCKVVTCEDTGCASPDTGLLSKAGYSCNCEYHMTGFFVGGCRINSHVEPSTACHCNYLAAWTCNGHPTFCLEATSRFCISPGENCGTCYQGQGDCGGCN